MPRTRKTTRQASVVKKCPNLEETLLRRLDKIEDDITEMKCCQQNMTIRMSRCEELVADCGRRLQTIFYKTEDVDKFRKTISALENKCAEFTKNTNSENSKIEELECYIYKDTRNKLNKLDMKVSTLDWSMKADLDRMEESIIGLPMLRSALENLRKHADHKLRMVEVEINKLKMAAARAGQPRNTESSMETASACPSPQPPGWTSRLRAPDNNNTTVSDRDLAHVCSVVATEYYRVGLELGLSTEMLSRCSAKSRDDNYRKTIEMLKLWKMKESRNATWDKLFVALRRLGLSGMVTSLQDKNLRSGSAKLNYMDNSKLS